MPTEDHDLANRAIGGRSFAVYSVSLSRPTWGRAFACVECLRRYPNPSPVAVADFDPDRQEWRAAVKVHRKHSFRGRLAGQAASGDDDRRYRDAWVEVHAGGDVFHTECSTGHPVDVTLVDLQRCYRAAANLGLHGPIPLAAA